MEKGQWSSVAAMANYLHDDDEGKQEAQMKLDGTRVDCATSNVNANIRGRPRTTAHVSGGLNISGHQGRRGKFFRKCASHGEAWRRG
jgi:hypothetical protein